MATIQGKQISALLHDIAANVDNTYAQGDALNTLFTYQNTFLPSTKLQFDFDKTTISLLNDENATRITDILPS